MSKITSEQVINRIFGSKNVILNSSVDAKDIYIGDQNIFFDLETTKLKTACPRCGEAADESLAEDNVTYKSFECISCGNIYFEHDVLARNVSNYLDLDRDKSIEFERLISAVNHDIKVGDFKVAFSRCLNHKETYGNTPQIYDWGALTLFYNTPLDELIKTSCSKIILYLNRSLELSKGKPTESYGLIASSIATRYFKAIYDQMKAYKAFGDYEIPDDKSARHDFYIGRRKNIYKLLLELRTCYRISQDTDFAVKGLEELYGYNGIAWFDRKLVSIFRKIKQTPEGFRRGLKGFAWDYHIVVSNCDEYFDEYSLKPSQLSIYFENILLEKGDEFELSEVRVGETESTPVSALGKLSIIAITIHLTIMVSIVVFYILISKILAISCVIFYSGLIYLSYRSNTSNIDDFRRIIDLNREGDVKKTIDEISEQLNLEEFKEKVKEAVKLKVKK